jgi:hypothetical protein
MRTDLIKRKLASFLVSTAMLYGSIFAVNWLSPQACTTKLWLPSIHCQWDLRDLF